MAATHMASREDRGGGGATYEYATEPQAAPHHRPRFREEEEEAPSRPMNIMWDPRVYRGSNFGMEVLTPAMQAEMERMEKAETDRSRRRAASRRRREEEGSRVRTPEPVAGREHAGAQTDEYLEEITDRPVEEEVGVQTDAFTDRPPSPLFVPHKTGVDQGTMIEAGELFDFDFEAEPVLEVLVGKTLEHALMEVLEEEELAAIRRHQEEFEQIRAAELAEVQRLEAEARRKAEEKKRRMLQESERVRREAQAKEKVAAAAFARRYLQEVRESVFSTLEREGHFYDPVGKEIKESFLPSVLEATTERTKLIFAARALADDVLRRALEKQRQARADFVEEQRRQEEERRRQLEEEERARREEEERKRKEEEERAAAEAAAAAADDEDADADADEDDD